MVPVCHPSRRSMRWTAYLDVRSCTKQMIDLNGVQSLRVIEPFVAKRDFRGTNCLECHAVPEGTVLGAVSITLDVTEEFDAIRKADIALWSIQAATQIIIYLRLAG